MCPSTGHHPISSIFWVRCSGWNVLRSVRPLQATPLGCLGARWYMACHMLPEVMLPCCLNAVEGLLFNLPCIFGAIGICCTGYDFQLIFNWFSTDFQLIFNWSSDSHHGKSSSRVAITRTKMTVQNPETDPQNCFLFQLFRCVKSSLFLRISLDDSVHISSKKLVKEMMTKPVLVRNRNNKQNVQNRCCPQPRWGKEHHVVKFRCFDVTEGPENAIYGETLGSIGTSQFIMSISF